jgi:hypothetical protein
MPKTRMIEDMGFSPRFVTALRKAGFIKWNQIAKMKREDLASIPRLGNQALDAIEAEQNAGNAKPQVQGLSKRLSDWVMANKRQVMAVMRGQATIVPKRAPAQAERASSVGTRKRSATRKRRSIR